MVSSVEQGTWARMSVVSSTVSLEDGCVCRVGAHTSISASAKHYTSRPGTGREQLLLTKFKTFGTRLHPRSNRIRSSFIPTPHLRWSLILTALHDFRYFCAPVSFPQPHESHRKVLLFFEARFPTFLAIIISSSTGSGQR